MKPKFSIIVPVYNSEKTLKKCIDSILGQTLQDFELILVDDGSADSSLRICKEYSYLNNLRVISQPNGGVSKARNTGISVAKGEWLCFVDSDDYIESAFLSSFGILDEQGLYVQAYKMIGCEETAIKISNTSSIDELFCLLELNNVINSPWGKAFSNSVVKTNKLLFNETLSYGEDHVFVLDYISKVKRIIYIETPLYAYCSTNAESLTQRVIPVSIINTYIKTIEKNLSILLDRGIISESTFKQVLTFRSYHAAIRSIASAMSSGKSMVDNQIKIVRTWTVNKKYLNAKQRIYMLIINYMPVCLISSLMVIIKRINLKNK